MNRLWAIVPMMILWGCAAVDQQQAEYDRVEYIETQFKPAVAACKAGGGILVYRGPSSPKMRRILDKQDWGKLRRIETIYFACMERT